MLYRQPPSATSLLLASTLALVSVACSDVNPLDSYSESVKGVSDSKTDNTNSLPNTPKFVDPTVVKTSDVNVGNPYEWAMEAAGKATMISQSAQSIDDWNLAINHWLEAIDFLKTVPTSSPYYAIANNKIGEYQRQLIIAQQQVTRLSQRYNADTVTLSPNITGNPFNPTAPENITPSELGQPKNPSKSISSNFKVVTVPIKRRASGTPVIEVTFNGLHTFEMVMDTGASTTVITPTMADQIDVKIEDILMADTASEKRVKFGAGRVKSIAVEGAVAKNIKVAIANSGLEVGLLGQDFLSRYDVLMKRDVIEFHRR